MQAFIAQHFAAKEIVVAGNLTTLLGLERRRIAQGRLFQGHFFGALEQITDKDIFQFTILRDPVERALSHYGHVLRDNEHYLHRRALELGSFDAYLDDPIAGMTVINFQARMLALDSNVRELYQALSEQERQEWCLERYVETTDFGLSADAVLAKARERLSDFDVVGITEHFSETLALLCFRRGWPYPGEIGAKNVNKDRPLRESLAPQTLNRLIDLNATDFALYESARLSCEEDFRHMLAGLVTDHANKFNLKRILDWLNG